MTKLVSLLFAASLLTTAACSGKGSSCDAAVDNAEKITGIKLEGEMRKNALAKCEKGTPAQRECVIKASSMEDLMKCGAKE
jgi:hypothetical protein